MNALMLAVAHVTYVVLWGSMAELKHRGFEDRQVTQACEEAASHEKDGGAIVLRVTNTPSMSTYAVVCSTPRCAEPPATVSVERVTCARVPERKVVAESFEPEHWEVK